MEDIKIEGVIRSKMTKEVMSIIENAAEDVVKMMCNIPLEVDGAPMASVKYADNSFKKKTIMGGWSFFLVESYVGARGDIIFGLSPEDPQEYETAEFSVKQMDEIFPIAGTELSKLIGIEGENFKTLINQYILVKSNEAIEEEAKAKEAYESEVNGFGAF